MEDEHASEDLLAELAAESALPELEAPRRGVWLSEPGFNIVHVVLGDETKTSYLASRVFGGINAELVIRLDCETPEALRNAYADFRASGFVTGSLTPGATATGEMIGPFAVHLAVDNGAGPHAMGEVHLDAAGTPVSYTVAPDDEYSHIARRFGFYGLSTPTESPAYGYNAFTGYLTVLNSVRRGHEPWILYAGDIVNLSAHTVTSVGSINGRVTSLPAPDPLPPQR